MVSVTPHGMSWRESSVETEQDPPVGLAGSMEIPETLGRGVVGPMTPIINAWAIAVELADNILTAGGRTAVGVVQGLSGSRGVNDEKNDGCTSDVLHYEIGQVQR